MAVGQTIYTTQLPVQHLNHSSPFIYPFNLSASSLLVIDKKQQQSSSLGRRREVKTNKKTHNDMSKATSYGTLSTPKASTINKTGVASSSSVTTVRPIDTAAASTFQHRRQSSQSLTLDLEGLDLGQGARSAGGLEQQHREEIPWSRRTESRSRSRFRSANATTKVQEELPKEQERHVEDSFFAHLRKCEDSYDILDTAHALSLSTPNQSDELETQTATQQVLGGFASLGYNSNTPSQVNVLDVDSETSPNSSVPASPYLGSRKYRKLPWRTLVSILHDPMTTLDILSIEEMGQHSIDVGSKEWEGFSLSYQCDSCNQSEDEEEGLRTAQWAVAKSSKKQKKLIVAPDSLSPSRTVIVSDHIASGSGSKREIASPVAGSPPIFVCQASFDLRFLQPGKGAPNLTITLTNPAAHRTQAAQNGYQSTTSKNESNSKQSHGKFEEQPLSVNMVSIHNADALRKEEQEANPSCDSRPTLAHSKSSSTIHATIPMVQLESRRPSLGKSISQDSFSFHSPMHDSSRRLSKTSLSTVTMNDAVTVKGYWQASNSMYKPIIVSDDTVGSELAFADYSIGLKPMVESATYPIDMDSEPSSRSSLLARTSMPMLCEANDRIPVLSTIDSERMAEYYRLSSERYLPNYVAVNRFNDVARQQGGVSSSPVPGLQRPSVRKDRRLSEWFKKKVLPSGVSSPPTTTTPLPAAWEQQRDVHSIATTTVNRNAVKAAKPGKPVKSYSNTSKSSSGVSTSPQIFKGDSYPTSMGSPHSLSQASLSSGVQSDVEDSEHRSKSIKMNIATPLSQMQTAQGQNVWPGVFSQRNERRRSNSDDHLFTLGETAKRKVEAPGSGIAQTPRVASDWIDPANQQDDTLTQLSLSLPSQSVLSAYGGDVSIDTCPKDVPTDLLDLDNVPNKSMTMVIPLPMTRRSNQSPARYIRVSYVPFGADQASNSEDSDRESCDEGHGQAAVPAWYKKLTSALSTGARSSSPGSSNDDSESDEATQSKGVAESFRIIAKVLEPPNLKRTTFKDYSLPPATPFPVILGWCDQQRSIKLVPEGWQAIGLANGPAESDSPLGGLADLIMAGCAASMEL